MITEILLFIGIRLGYCCNSCHEERMRLIQMSKMNDGKTHLGVGTLGRYDQGRISGKVDPSGAFSDLGRREDGESGVMREIAAIKTLLSSV